MPLTSRQTTFLSFVSQPQPLQQHLDDIVLHLGQSLATALISQVGGTAMRSDIEFLSEPIKKLYGRHPRAKTWFEHSLMITEESTTLDPTLISQAELSMVARMPINERKMLVRALGVTVDMSTVRKICGEFWT